MHGSTFVTWTTQRWKGKRRSHRVGRAVLRLGLIAAAIGITISVSRQLGQPAPSPVPITVANVSQLHLMATASLDGAPRGIAFAPGFVFVTDDGRKQLVTFSASCGERLDICVPSWVAETGHKPAASSSIRWAGGGAVYVATDALYAYSTSCGSGGTACEPLWVGRVNGRPLEALLGQGAVYVVTSRSKLYSFPTTCVTEAGSCRPNWVSRRVVSPYSEPVVSGNSVYVRQLDSTRYLRFSVTCGSGEGTCRPSATLAISGGKHWSPGAISWPSPSGPTLFTAAAGRASSGKLEALPITKSGLGPPLWTARVTEGIGIPAVTSQEVFVPSPGVGHVEAFPVDGCDIGSARRSPPCRPLWTASGLARISPAPMAVANGLLFVPQNAGRISAFPTDCGAEHGECAPVWIWPGTGHPGNSAHEINALVATRTRVYLASSSGKLFVFGVGPRPPSPPGPTTPDASAKRSALIFYAVVAMLMAPLLIVRRRRRLARTTIQTTRVG